VHFFLIEPGFLRPQAPGDVATNGVIDPGQSVKVPSLIRQERQGRCSVGGNETFQHANELPGARRLQALMHFFGLLNALAISKGK
jgi:hypothetical protein